MNIWHIFNNIELQDMQPNINSLWEETWNNNNNNTENGKKYVTNEENKYSPVLQHDSG